MHGTAAPSPSRCAQTRGTSFAANRSRTESWLKHGEHTVVCRAGDTCMSSAYAHEGIASIVARIN